MTIRTFPRILLAALIFFTIPAFSQFNASLSGTVMDPTQAVVPGATVTLTNAATQQTRTTTTGNSGAYTFSQLGPGAYNITANASGFKTTALSNIALAAETPRNVDITLNTGGASETVNVNANAVPVLQTADASIGNTLTSEAIQRLPSIGGDPYELLRTAPGITGDAARSGSGTAVFLPNGAGPGQSNRGIFQTENQVQISASGLGVGGNDYTIDGVSVNSLGQAGSAVITPNQESVAQMTVLSTSYSAEDGRDFGAHIKVVTKSGTNDLHGSLYFRYDEPGLNAYNKNVNGPGTTFAGVPIRVNNKERDYAASLGGPIVKDKLFLFASYEGFKLSNNTFTNQFVETPQFDAAALSGRPDTVAAAILGSGGVTPRVAHLLTPTCAYYITAGFPCQVVGTGIDVGSFGNASNNGTYFFNKNCKVSTDNACKAGYAVGTGGYETGAGLDGIPDLQYAQLLIPQHSHASQYNGRVDFNPSASNQFAFSAFVTKLDNYGVSSATNSRPQGDVPFKPLNEAGTFIFIHIFTPNLLNEFRANATRFADNAISDGAGTVNYGIPYIDIQTLPGGNDVNYGTSQGPTSPAILAENTYEVRDMVVKSSGNRTLRIGGEYRWEQDNNNLAGSARPVYSFQGLFNFANNAPIFEGINADPATGGIANTARYLRSQTLGLFVQHDWKVTPSFTLNTGLRYEYFSPFHNKTGPVNLPVLGPAGSELTGAALVPHNNFFQPDYTGYSPKIGFAWTPGTSGKMVIRGGIGRAMNRLNFSTLDNAVEDGPGYFNYGICCGQATADGIGDTSGNSSPFSNGRIQYQTGTSNSPFSYAPNSALITKLNSRNLPANGTGIEVYGAPARVKTPYAYVYSLETQVELPSSLTITIGYQGSTAHHLPRLVNQNFLYSNAGANPFNASYFLQTDSNSTYNALNIHLARVYRHGFQFDATYTYSKVLDQVSNGYGADAAANQTNPADNTTEWGPADYDTRHRLTVTALWDIPGTKGGMHIANVLTNGWQINGIYTFHTGFPFTPVTSNLASNPFVTSAATISPTRPYAYFGGFQSSCSNSNYISGNDVKNTRFLINVPAGQTYRPGIGRNSFSGPCYNDTDLSVARQQKFSLRDHPLTLRFQANFFNVFNTLNLSPFTNGNGGGPALIVGGDPTTDPTVASARATSNFGKPTAADAGRQIEFFARLFF